MIYRKYKNTLIPIISFLLVTIIFSCVSTKQMNYLITEKRYKPELLINDVDYTYKLLTKGHPGVYWYISKEKLDYKFDSLKNSLVVPLTNKEFYKKLAPVIASIKCGHTRLITINKTLTKKEKDSTARIIKPINQFSYKVLNDKLYIKSFNNKITQVKRGDEIIAIDGEPFSKIRSELIKNFSSDGYNTTYLNEVLDRGFIGWYEGIKNSKDTLNFMIKRKDSIVKVVLTAVRSGKEDLANDIKNKIVVDKNSSLDKKQLVKEKLKLRYKGTDENDKPMLDLQFLEKDSSVAYLKVKGFSFPHANFNKFFKESFAEIKNGNAKDLIIDIRNNRGGSLKACRNLFSYLVEEDFIYLKQGEIEHKFNPYWHAKGLVNAVKGLTFEVANLIRTKKRNGKYYVNFKGTKPLHAKTNNYNGKVYVLINGYSFSASALFAANVKGIERATFVGQETGGGFNGCVAGNIPVLNLPNTKLKLRMGLFPILPNAQTEIVGRGIFPDKEINNTIEDVISGKDKELEWVMKDIKKK